MLAAIISGKKEFGKEAAVIEAENQCQWFEASAFNYLNLIKLLSPRLN